MARTRRHGSLVRLPLVGRGSTAVPAADGPAVPPTADLRGTTWPSHSTPRSVLRTTASLRPHTACTYTFIAFFIVAEKWKPPKRSPADSWVNSAVRPCGGCYSAAGRNAALTGAAVRMSLENLTLSERSRPRKATFRRVPSAGNVQNGQIYRDRKHGAGRRGRGE